MEQKVVKKQINSHIQMPKFMLKQFENSKHELYCYDITNGKIRKGKANSINTKVGYFSETAEALLNKRIEQPFSNMLRYLKSINFDSNKFSLKDVFVKNARAFLNALLARNPNTFNSIKKSSVYLQLMNEQTQHDMAVFTCYDEAEKSGFFNNYYLTFTVNKSKEPFVLPICGFYWYNNNKNLNLPITPWLAITMVNEEMRNKLIKDGKVRMYLVTKKTEVHKLNYIAFQEQKSQKYGCVVSKNRYTLMKMKMYGIVVFFQRLKNNLCHC